MQDRFKFRVFISDKKNSKNSLTGMFKVHSLHTGTNKAIITSLYGNCSIKLENNVLMQCTGLKDKNGKLIYEGDVVKDLTYPHNVRYLCVFAPIFGGLGLISMQNWKDYNFCRENWEDYYSNSEVRRLDNRFKLANQGNKLNCFSMKEPKMSDYEVIGNIYENPELLEVEQ